MLLLKTIPNRLRSSLRAGRNLGWLALVLLSWQVSVAVILPPSVGLEQSPIDINAAILTPVDKLPKLKFDYGKKVNLVAVNTGSPDEHATVRADVPPGAAKLTVSGKVYHLRQFHWHTPSEHTINGQHSPLEMHLVHQADDGALLVVGVLIVEDDKNTELDKIFARLPQTTGATVAVSKFDLRKLLPGDRDSFRYAGSLTTPPFGEGVQWIVLAEAIEMSPRQIAAFEHLFPHENTRPAQALNGRVVVTDLDNDDLNDLDEILED